MDSATTGRSPQAVVLPVLSSIAVVVSIPPIILHWKNRNFPATALIGWFLLINTFNIINALIWPTDDVDSWWDGHGLCDVETKVMIASYVGIPGTLVCIFRSLASVLDTRSAMLVPSIGQRWRDRLMDFSFCVIIPVIAMGTHILYQRSRYLILTISGARRTTDSATSGTTTCSHEDIEKGPAPRQESSSITRSYWVPLPRCLLGRTFLSTRETAISDPNFSVPATTVSTNAWAGASQSRGSSDFTHAPVGPDTIRVKQVISQESELQV
ncbi:a-factor receptor [Aspergillus fumigatus]